MGDGALVLEMGSGLAVAVELVLMLPWGMEVGLEMGSELLISIIRTIIFKRRVTALTSFLDP